MANENTAATPAERKNENADMKKQLAAAVKRNGELEAELKGKNDELAELTPILKQAQREAEAAGKAVEQKEEELGRARQEAEVAAQLAKQFEEELEQARQEAERPDMPVEAKPIAPPPVVFIGDRALTEEEAEAFRRK